MQIRLIMHKYFNLCYTIDSGQFDFAESEYGLVLTSQVPDKFLYTC